MKAAVITACDELYAVLAQDLFLSLRALKFKAPFDCGLLDVGMSAEKRDAFAAGGIKVVPAQSDIDYPARAHWEKVKPGVRTLTAQPSLRRYFPGYDLYIWLDADAWVQTPEAIDTMMAEAPKSNAMLVAAELDRCYTTFFRDATMWHKFGDWYRLNFGDKIAADMLLKPMLNVGVWALRADAPHWEAWGTLYRQALQRMTELDESSFMAHQLALNVAHYIKGLPSMVLPASFNWLTTHAMPKYDRASGKFVEPMPPYRPLSHLHLTQPNKLSVEKIACTDGGVIETALTFAAQKRV